MTGDRQGKAVEAMELLEVHIESRRDMGQHGMADQMAECVAVLSSEIDRLRAALNELDAMYRRIAPDDPEGLHPDLHPAWKACKAALRTQGASYG